MVMNTGRGGDTVIATVLNRNPTTGLDVHKQGRDKVGHFVKHMTVLRILLRGTIRHTQHNNQ